MVSLRAHALITGALFAALIVLGWVGNLIEALDLLPRGPGIRLLSVAVFLALSIALAFSVIPLTVQLVLGFQVRLGNANRPVIRALIARQRVIVFVLWSLIALGLAIAIPAAILDGAFDTTEVAAPTVGPPR
jgi:hypothetical protein